LGFCLRLLAVGDASLQPATPPPKRRDLKVEECACSRKILKLGISRGDGLPLLPGLISVLVQDQLVERLLEYRGVSVIEYFLLLVAQATHVTDQQVVVASTLVELSCYKVMLLVQLADFALESFVGSFHIGILLAKVDNLVLQSCSPTLPLA
jgi:hypothetical protein